MPARWSLRFGLVWLIVLAGAAWYLGRDPNEDDISVMAWLALGMVFMSTAALGAALMTERHRGLLAVAAALVGGFVAMLVFSMSVLSDPSGADSYYPQFVFVEFSVVLLVTLAIGAIFETFWRVIRG
jgi:hypothetical protein